VKTAAFLLLFCLAAVPACGRLNPPPPPSSEAPVEWTPEQIAASPEAYLEHAIRQIDAQLSLREERITTMGRRRLEAESRSAELIRSLEEAGNLRNRLTGAIRRAEDEDRWPIQFAGRSFTREKAGALLESINRFEQQRAPLAVAYRDEIRRMEQGGRSLRAVMDGLAKMREEVTMDLERIRLNQGPADMDGLRKTAARLADFSDTLLTMSEDPMEALSGGGESLMDLNDLLNQQ